ncbi:MAG: hypothetical protein VR65_10190 [Desulfobulbaceae bacterium BRH_c16a]|nr:MAG: hypothetical protein VR65_10190 [Desulfobulbaceae bacterium BRH_c16a]
MKSKNIKYIFNLEGENKEVFLLELDPVSLEMIAPAITPLPEWARLGHHQCPHCPLKIDENPYCPLAASISGVVKQFQHIISYDEIFLQVETDERMTSQKTTTQRALSSFMGVVMAVSGCPHTSFFKPMARFHLPLASEEETIYRSTSMYLLAQYFRLREGFEPDVSLAGLDNIYKNIQIINSSIIDRLRGASKADSSANAIIILDMYARIMPYVIEDALEDIRYLFAPYLR